MQKCHEAITLSTPPPDTGPSPTRATPPHACTSSMPRSSDAVQERYQAASMSWQHPDTCYPPAALTALAAAKHCGDLVAERHAAWQHAFTGLYHALRHRKCHAFYLATPQVQGCPPRSTHAPHPPPAPTPASHRSLRALCHCECKTCYTATLQYRAVSPFCTPPPPPQHPTP